MFRHQLHVQVRTGEFREFFRLFQRLDTLVRTRKLSPAQLWTPSFGPVNAAVFVTDFESYEAYSQNDEAFHEDAEVMDLWREMMALLDGIPWDELWEVAMQVA